MSGVIVIVGAGPGLGSAVARRFGRSGFGVALVGRRRETVREIGRGLQADGVRAGWAQADVADAALLTEVLGELAAGAGGRIDVLHHNVSAYRDATASQTSAEDLLADLAVGTASLLTAARAVLPGMLAAGRGVLLATGGGTADRPMTGAASLGVQKAAQRNLVQALDAELAPSGVRAATLMVRGIMRPGTPYAPDRVADALHDLAARGLDRQDDWEPVVDFVP